MKVVSTRFVLLNFDMQGFAIHEQLFMTRRHIYLSNPIVMRKLPNILTVDDGRIPVFIVLNTFKANN